MIQANKNGFMYAVMDCTNCKPGRREPLRQGQLGDEDRQGETGRPVLTDIYKKFLAGEEVEIFRHAAPPRCRSRSIRTPGSFTPTRGTFSAYKKLKAASTPQALGSVSTAGVVARNPTFGPGEVALLRRPRSCWFGQRKWRRR